jgi:hypothetical protein
MAVKAKMDPIPKAGGAGSGGGYVTISEFNEAMVNIDHKFDKLEDKMNHGFDLVNKEFEIMRKQFGISFKFLTILTSIFGTLMTAGISIICALIYYFN